MSETTTDKASTETAGQHERLVMHWYCFTYNGKTIDGGQGAIASTYTGYIEKDMITRAMIQQNKLNAGVTEDAVLMAVSYLGEGTKEEFLGA